MLPIPYLASLRVYERIDLFEEVDQVRWSKVPITHSSYWDEQVKSLMRAILSEPPNLKLDGVHLLELDNTRYVAPWSTTARCRAALEEFKQVLPTSVIQFFIPKNLEDTIGSTIDTFENKISHILTSNWSIPPRWFALFSPEDRKRGVIKDTYLTIFRTSIARAKIRCKFTHQAVLRAFGEGTVESEVAELLSWLEFFEEGSILELDYGGLATYLNKLLVDNGEAGLDADTSVEDVSSSIAGLASGDVALAGRGYERLISRWRKVSALEFAT